MLSRKIELKFCLFFCFFSLNFAFAQSVENKKILPQDVINSVLVHYPKIISYYEKVDAAKSSYLASQGFFDVKLRQEYQDRTRGFYDGKISDTTIEKQNQFLGSKIYGGYRKSSGNFPNYEGNSVTNHDGEVRAGIKFSLLQNSSIDQNRLGMMLAQLGFEESKVQLENIKIEIQRDALKNYWNWVIAGKIYQIYRNLYELAIKREKQLEARFAKGDIAKIIISENKKNLLSRKSAMLEIKRNFENSATYLSLFLRDQKGNPIIAEDNSLPEIKFLLEEIDNQKFQQDIEKALQNRVEVQVIKIKKREEVRHLEYANNLFKPKFDVEAGASKDLGSGLQERSQSNNFIKLEFEMPLQFREARGKISASQSKLNAINYEEQLIEEQIRVQITQLKNNIHNAVEIYKNAKEEVHFAEILENAEREKFKQGASNFFLVNMREQDSAASKAAQMMMFKRYQENLLDYKAAIFNFD